ncbi:MAG: sulfatase [Planctomycetes bacterium]|nr:sulfatase [Planctomycetota bacterium]
MNSDNIISRRDFLKTTGIFAGGLLASSGVMNSAFGGEPSGKKPNVILLAVDTLRADHCSCYGYGRSTTPFLDSVAKEGVRFSNYTSTSSWTTPSIMSMFTGVSPIQHGVVTTRNVLPDTVPTLASQMRELGYHTVGVLCNPCAVGRMGFNKGFDLYDDFTILLDFELNLFDVGNQSRKQVHRAPTSKKITDLALRHMTKIPKDKPLFLFVLYYDPHGDYVPLGKYEKMFVDPAYSGKINGSVYGMPGMYKFENKADRNHMLALYDAEIRQADDEVSRLIGELRNKGICTDDDLLICLADHGEEFCEHGGLRHGRTLYNEVTQVPLIMRWPGKLPAGKVVDNLCDHKDLAPTILGAVGGKAREYATGADLISIAKGESSRKSHSLGLHVQAEGNFTGWRTEEWLLLNDMRKDRTEAYNLQDDPLQKKTVAASDAKVASLMSEMKDWVRHEEKLFVSHVPDGKIEESKLTRQQIEALKAMGYIH